MAFDWAGLRDNDIDPVIEELGQNLTLYRVTKNMDGGNSKPWDSLTGSEETTASETVKGVVYDIDLQERFQSGGLIKRGDRNVVISAKGVLTDPDLNDRIVIDGAEWHIVEVLQKINPGGIVVAYVLQVRK